MGGRLGWVNSLVIFTFCRNVPPIKYLFLSSFQPSSLIFYKNQVHLFHQSFTSLQRNKTWNYVQSHLLHNRLVHLSVRRLQVLTYVMPEITACQNSSIPCTICPFILTEKTFFFSLHMFLNVSLTLCTDIYGDYFSLLWMATNIFSLLLMTTFDALGSIWRNSIQKQPHSFSLFLSFSWDPISY